MAEAFSSAENTYIINIESGAETARLLDQDRLVTFFMQSLFPPQVDLSKVYHVLDVACGPGEWARDVAFHYPEMKVAGVDINRTMIEYARDMALVRKLDNVTYRVMNVLEPLDFPDNAFDFVNARFLVGLMSPSAWPELVKECMRITRPGGIIRLTECDNMGTTNSPAYNRLKQIAVTAMQKAGRTFSPDGLSMGITNLLGRFLRDAGCQNIQRSAYAIDYSAGEKAHAAVCLDIQMATKLSQPFMVKMGVTDNKEMDDLYEQMVNEMEAETFNGLWIIVSVWGEKP
ncbi:MAG TPA: class I SAM-dependent methyltransferase [Ktedonosporobacter sp.]|jgi:ubiquinone/menaquinone biosynthesis C-methylase UbiE|nr:class I SAM-dependent methyltransferase [Ktedonosporobacter sp.]